MRTTISLPAAAACSASASPKEVDLAASSIHAELWHGELCYELSEMEQERTFPMSDEGRAAMQQWLEENIEPIEPKTAE